MGSLYLPEVTLVMIDTVAHKLAGKAISDCRHKTEFSAVVVLADEPVYPIIRNVEHHTVPKNKTIDDAMRVLWYEMPMWIKSSYILLIQWDSWIVDPTVWDEEFLNYDYIGAPWWYGDDYNVGNGGFSLRSKRLIQHLEANREKYPLAHPEDDALCRRYGPRLCEEGFKFAPEALARQFSFERGPRRGPTFGFHGMFNWPHVLTDKQIKQRMELASPYVLNNQHCAEMQMVLQAQGREI